MICKQLDCSNSRLHGSKYCIKHKCKTCKNIAKETFEYCDDHACLYIDCESMRLKGFQLCSSHKCEIKICGNSVSSYYDQLSKYCNTHRCAIGDCSNVRTFNCEFCEIHKCKDTNCRKPNPNILLNNCEIQYCEDCRNLKNFEDSGFRMHN